MQPCLLSTTNVPDLAVMMLMAVGLPPSPIVLPPSAPANAPCRACSSQGPPKTKAKTSTHTHTHTRVYVCLPCLGADLLDAEVPPKALVRCVAKAKRRPKGKAKSKAKLALLPLPAKSPSSTPSSTALTIEPRTPCRFQTRCVVPSWKSKHCFLKQGFCS